MAENLRPEAVLPLVAGAVAADHEGMGILVVLAFFIIISLLAMAGRGVDSRDDAAERAWYAPFTAGRDPTRRLHPS
jgi:hypothetical protein